MHEGGLDDLRNEDAHQVCQAHGTDNEGQVHGEKHQLAVASKQEAGQFVHCPQPSEIHVAIEHDQLPREETRDSEVRDPFHLAVSVTLIDARFVQEDPGGVCRKHFVDNVQKNVERHGDEDQGVGSTGMAFVPAAQARW